MARLQLRSKVSDSVTNLRRQDTLLLEVLSISFRNVSPRKIQYAPEVILRFRFWAVPQLLKATHTPDPGPHIFIFVTCSLTLIAFQRADLEQPPSSIGCHSIEYIFPSSRMGEQTFLGLSGARLMAIIILVAGAEFLYVKKLSTLPSILLTGSTAFLATTKGSLGVF